MKRHFRNPYVHCLAATSTLLITALTSHSVSAASLYWKTNATPTPNAWDSASWAASPGGPYTTAWSANSDVVFEANAGTALTITGATTQFASITANENTTLTPGGTLGTNGTIATVTVAERKTLNFAGQALSSTAGTGFIKNGTGTWTLQNSGTGYNGGFTLNAGNVALGGVNALGVGGTLTINGGVIRSDSSTGRSLFGKLDGGVTVNSDVTFGDSIMYGDTNYAGGTGALAFDANFNLGATTRTFTCNSNLTIDFNSTISGGSITGGATTGLIKNGPGTLTIKGNTGCTFGGGLTIGGSGISAQFTNMTTPTNMIGAGNNLNFSYGNPLLSFVGKNAVSNSQTLGNVTVNNSRAQIGINPGTTGASFALTLGTINSSMSAGAGLLDLQLLSAAVGVTTTSAPDSTGIYGPRVVYSSNAGLTKNWAATASGAAPYTLGDYAGYAAMLDTDPVADSDNVRLAISTALTTLDSQTHNTLKVAGATISSPVQPPTILTLGAGTTLTLTGGGILMDGTAAAATIQGGTITAGDGGSTMGYNPYELVINPFNSSSAGSTVSSVIADNPADSGHAVSVTINGTTSNPPTGALIALGTSNTYTGTTTLNGASRLGDGIWTINARLGNVSGTDATFGNAGPLALNGAIIRVAGADTTGRAITLNNSSGFHAQAFTVNLNGPITGTGNLSVDCNNGGNLVLGNDNSFSGDVLFQTDGKLTLNHVDALKNATLNLTGQRIYAVLNGASGNLAYNIGGLKGNATELKLGTGGTGGKVSIGSNAQSNTFLGVLGASTDAAGLIKKGSGTQTVVKCAYAGDTVVEAGTLKLGAVGQVNFSAKALTNDSTTGLRTLPVAGGDLPNLAVGQIISGTGVTGLDGSKIVFIDSATPKVFLDTAVAAGATTYTGSFGAMNGSIASPVIEVKAGATLDVATLSSAFPVSSTQTLGGAGTVLGPVSVAGKVSPGVGTANLATTTGTLTTGNVAFTATGEYACTLNGATCDLLTAGPLTVDPAAKITFTGTPTAASLVIATYSGAEPTHFATDPSLPAGYTLDYSSPGQIRLVSGSPTPPYQTWASSKGLSGGAANSTADPDGDDLDNAIEFVIGGEPNPANPGAASSALAPTVQTTSTDLVFTFRRTAQSLTQPGINIVMRYGSNLSDWTEVPIPTTTPGSPVNGATIIITPDGFGTGVDKVEVKVPKSLAIGARLFGGLKVAIPAP